MKKHVAAVHEGIRYPCTCCDYQAARLPDLKQHMNVQHKGIGYQCDFCEYKATCRSTHSTKE